MSAQLEASVKKLSGDEIKAGLAALKDKWSLSSDLKSISITYDCSTYANGVLLATAVAHVADKVNHHPTITIDYKKVQFVLSTHDAGGLSDLDFKLARSIETLNYKPAFNEW